LYELIILGSVLTIAPPEVAAILNVARRDKLNKKKVLGRGLDALISNVEAPKSRYQLCPVDDITPNRRQPRKRLIVRGGSGSFELVVGERRLRASKIAGLKEVPVIVVDATDEESLELAIVENIHREDLNAIEEAEAYRTLLGFGLSQEEVARKVGKERATVSNYLRLLNLPPEVKEEIIKGKLTMGHARAILSLPGHAAQRELCRKVIKRGLSVRETELLATRGSSPFAGTGKRTLHLKSVEEELRRAFGAARGR
jgi:ParB family chromosome partitioning protein